MSMATGHEVAPRRGIRRLCADRIQALARLSHQLAEMIDEAEVSLAEEHDAVEQLELVWRRVVEEQPPMPHEAMRPLWQLLLSRFDTTLEDAAAFDDAALAIEAIQQSGLAAGKGLRRLDELCERSAELVQRVQSIRQQLEEHWPALDADDIDASRRYFADGGVGLSLEDMLHDVST